MGQSPALDAELKQIDCRPDNGISPALAKFILELGYWRSSGIIGTRSGAENHTKSARKPSHKLTT